MKPKKSAKLCLALTLMMIILSSCSVPADYNAAPACLTWPAGGKRVGDVYQRLPPADKAILNEWFNRLYKLRQHPVFCPE